MKYLLLSALLLSGCINSTDKAISNFSRSKKIYVTEQTTNQVKKLYSNYNAEDSYNLGGLDSNNDGICDGEKVIRAWLQTNYPHINYNYNGPIGLDWEGHAGDILYTRSLEDPEFQATVEEFNTCLKVMRQIFPQAKLGYYGMPLGNYYHFDAAWKKRNAAMQSIFDASDVLFPSIYDLYRDGIPYHDNEQDLIAVRNTVQLALNSANGKPVYPYIWARYHDSTPDAYYLIPQKEFQKQIAAALDPTSPLGKKIDGFMWWGADVYFWWLAFGVTDPNSEYWPAHLQTNQAFLSELVIKDELRDVHLTNVHTGVLQSIREVLSR